MMNIIFPLLVYNSSGVKFHNSFFMYSMCVCIDVYANDLELKTCIFIL